jgi:phenylacetate-CoA ligase
MLYPLWAAKNGSARLRYLAEFEKTQYLPTRTLISNQLHMFKAMVVHAFETCPYYRVKFREARVRPEDIRSRDDLELVPTITKEEIQEHWSDMVSTKYRVDRLIRDMTGGSTGSPMTFYYDRDRLDSRVGATMRHNRWAGWNLGDRAAILWGAPQDVGGPQGLKDRIRTWIQERRLILDASALSEPAMAQFAHALVSYRPTVLQAYSNTLALFARYVQAEKVTGIHPRGIVCSAEVLTEESRRLIEETFGCPVFNRYGCREFAVIASECEVRDGLHINAENLLVEVLADGRSCVDKDGEIVVTDLRNFAMPMIRYRIRDMGRLTEASCACSRGLPTMELSGGRVTDFLRAVNGSKVSGIVLATYVITGIPGIRQIQFVQNEPGAVVIHAVKGRAWSESVMEELRLRVRKYLGDEILINVQFKDNIPLERSGKYRFSISTVG